MPNVQNVTITDGEVRLQIDDLQLERHNYGGETILCSRTNGFIAYSISQIPTDKEMRYIALLQDRTQYSDLLQPSSDPGIEQHTTSQNGS